MNLLDCVLEIHYQIIMKTILQERREFIAALQLGSQIIPMPQAIKIPATKAAVDKEWENWRKIVVESGNS